MLMRFVSEPDTQEGVSSISLQGFVPWAGGSRPPFPLGSLGLLVGKDLKGSPLALPGRRRGRSRLAQPPGNRALLPEPAFRLLFQVSCLE